MRLFTAPVIGLLLCGCTGQAPNATSGAQPAAAVETPAALPPNAYPVPEAPTPTISDADRPNTIDEFSSEFVRLYNQSMYAPFIELAYWGSSTVEQKKKYLSDVKATFTFNSMRAPLLIETVAQLEAIPFEKLDAEDRVGYPKEADESLQVIPEPTHVLAVGAYLLDKASAARFSFAADEEADYGGDEAADIDSWTRRLERGYAYVEFLVGVHDGKYYFCTIKQD